MTEQVVVGLRDAIQNGVFQIGSRVPSFSDMASQLGVSQIVIRRAVGRLTKEGFLIPRQGYGVVVADPKVPCWNGCVLFVTAEHKSIYITHFIAESLRYNLQKNGISLVHIVLTRDKDGKYQLDQLQRLMLQSVRLAVVYNRDVSVLRWFEDKRCPYVSFGSFLKSADSVCVGRMFFGFASALDSLMKCPVMKTVRRVLFVGLSNNSLLLSAVRMFTKAGIDCAKYVVRPLPGIPRPESFQRSVMEDFMSKKSPLSIVKPDLVFFTDDYIASGGLTAMLFLGIRVPEDVRVVSFANTGLGPVYVKSVTRLELDAREAAAIVSDAVVGYVTNGMFPSSLCLPVSFVAGETW